MTTIVRKYMDQYDLERLDAPEIRSIINQERNFMFNPVQEGKSFWYDIENKRIIVANQYEHFDLIIHRTNNETKKLSSNMSSNQGIQLEELYEGFLLLDTKGSEIAQAIHRIRNLRSEYELTDENTGAIAILAKYGLNHHANKFALDQTLFINDFQGLTKAMNSLSSNNILFSDAIEIIPSDAILGVGHLLPEELRIPMSIRIIERQAFMTLSPNTKIIYDNLANIRLERNVFHHTNMRNQELKLLEGTIELNQLIISFNCTISTTKYFSGLQGNFYIGKVERKTNEKYDYYNVNDVFIGSYDGVKYYDPDANSIQSGEVYEDLVLIRSLFQSATFYETKYNQNIDITMRVRNTEYNLEIHEISTTYHIIKGSTHIEVKGYDEYGNLFAKGKLVVLEEALSPGRVVPLPPYTG
jgi:hypothetical protein